jgi:rhodanese-related sulfurtransferase
MQDPHFSPLRGCVVAILASLVLTSCSRTPSPPSDPVERAAYWRRLDAEYEELTRGYDEETGAHQIGVATLREKLANGERVLLLDIREARENAVSSLPNARHVAPDDVDSTALTAAADVTVVTYCTAGYRSGIAAAKLEKRLGRKVLNLHGGIVAWFNAGGEVHDPSGQVTDKIDAYGPQWQKYVHAPE